MGRHSPAQMDLFGGGSEVPDSGAPPPAADLSSGVGPRAATPGEFLAALQQRGATRLQQVRFRRNRTVLWSLTDRGRCADARISTRLAGHPGCEALRDASPSWQGIPRYARGGDVGLAAGPGVHRCPEGACGDGSGRWRIAGRHGSGPGRPGRREEGRHGGPRATNLLRRRAEERTRIFSLTGASTRNDRCASPSRWPHPHSAAVCRRRLGQHAVPGVFKTSPRSGERVSGGFCPELTSPPAATTTVLLDTLPPEMAQCRRLG